MLNLNVTVPAELRDVAKRFIDRCKENPELMELAGNAVKFTLREHFEMKARRPNKRGFHKTGYWSKIESATTFIGSTAASATVAIQDDTFTAKIYGATITPKKAKALAIPLSDQAYGKRPTQWDNPTLLKLVKRNGKAPLLATVGSDGSINPQYVLLRRVRVPADAEALPRDEKIWKSVFDELETYDNLFE